MKLYYYRLLLLGFHAGILFAIVVFNVPVFNITPMLGAHGFRRDESLVLLNSAKFSLM